MASFMDIVIKEVLVKFGIKHQTLVGAHSARERIQIVNQFNNDTSVSVLILTTSVGGLGLTLTGADVVIFVEHDWNPMKDLQAMDRAHRMGQKRVVNVYRLITRNTLEEKISVAWEEQLNLLKVNFKDKQALVDVMSGACKGKNASRRKSQVNMNVRRMTMLPVEEMRKLSQMVGIDDDTDATVEAPAPEAAAPGADDPPQVLICTCSPPSADSGLGSR